uniref:Uncharacterized protein n=1 Tax=Romanomermis culicivorax TaxID=13658 RepID=A0A915JI22_ROMCU
MDAGFSKTLTYSELQKLKRQSNAMNALGSTDSNISRLAVRRGFDDSENQSNHHRTKSDQLYSKIKPQKRNVQVGWKNPVIDRAWSISSHNGEALPNDEKTKNRRGRPDLYFMATVTAAVTNQFQCK